MSVPEGILSNTEVNALDGSLSPGGSKRHSISVRHLGGILQEFDKHYTRHRYYEYGERRVHLDGCVEVVAAYYSAPPGSIGRAVRVQWDDRHVRLIDPVTGQLLREHLCQERGRHRIQDEDRSRKTPQSTTQLLARCSAAGPSIGALCHALHRREGEFGVRRILGILSLVKKYGAATLDAACATALEVNACEYRFIRRYLR